MRRWLIIALEVVVVAIIARSLVGGGGGESTPSLGQLRLTANGTMVTASVSVQLGTPALTELAVDWGDGNVDQQPTEGASSIFTMTAEHSYADERSFVVRLIAHYADGSEEIRKETLDVQATPLASIAASSPSGASGATATTATPTPAAGATPDATSTPEPTAEPTAQPTSTPTPTQTPNPTPAPTAQPTPSPTPSSTAEPTSEPTVEPTPSSGNEPPEINILSVDRTDDPLTIQLVVLVVDPEGQLAGIGVNWGDNATEEVSPSGGPIVLSHAYAAGGTYPVTVFALDAAGAETSAATAATVSP